jgi:hypothetical protein
MRKVLVLLGVTLALCAAASANTITTNYSVSANSTFFEQSSNDNCSSPLAVGGCQASYFMPTVIAVTPGDTIQLIESGVTCYVGTTADCMNLPLGGEFTSSLGILPSTGNQNRFLTNQVASGLPNIQDPNFNSYYNAAGVYTGTGINTQIPDDFYICGTVALPDCSSTNGTTVVVPAGANFLYVAALDSFFADNQGNMTLTVNDTPGDPASTPEPSTAMLMLGGLAAAAFGYRQRRVA